MWYYYFGDRMRIEIYGDSIRNGYGLLEKPYTEKISSDTVNYSFNGASAFDILELVYSQAEDKTAIAIVGCGVNDIIFNRDEDRIADRIIKIVERLLDLNKIVLVESILPVKKDYFLALHELSEDELNFRISKLNSILKESSEPYNYKFLEYAFDDERFSTRDGLHPDSYGNEQLYIQLNKFIRDINE